jgi:hypothetical protein
LDSPGKAVQLGKDALKAKVDYDLGVVDKAAAGARSAASAVYDFGRDLKTELPNTTAKQGLQALSNFGEGVTGEAIADYGEEGKSAIGKLALGAGVLAGMVGGEGEVAGARRIGRGLYSRLDDAFKLIPDKPLHPNAIMNLFKKAPGGVSTEEMAYRGVPEFLAGHGDKPVSRAALAAHLEANPAPFPKVKTLGHEPNKQAAWKRLEAAQEDMSNLQAELAKDGTVPQIDRANLPWIAQEIAKGDEASKLAQRKFDAIPLTESQRARLLESGQAHTEYQRLNNATPTAKYSQYQVPGGENYRETLMTLPHKAPEGVPDGFTVKQSSNGQWGVFGPGPMEENRYGSGATREAALEKFRSYGHTGKPDYRSPHFPDDPNLLLHTRANDRTLPKLGRGTFMEEGQSDLHQAGRKDGYGDKQVPAPTRMTISELPDPYVSRTGDVYRYGVTEHGRLISGNFKSVSDAEEELNRLRGTVTRTGVPDAPFKDSWPELGLKQQLLEVANDLKAKWFGFTSSGTQIKRYGTERMTWASEPGGGWRVNFEPQVGGEAEGIADLGAEAIRRGLTENSSTVVRTQEELAKVLGGSEVKAEKAWKRLQAAPDVGEYRPRAEGMAEFYDKKLVARLNKIVKPFGGVVERVKMGDEFAWIVKVTPEMKKKILASGLPLMAGVAMVDSRKDK